MVKKLFSNAMNQSVRRRDFLKGAAAVGMAGAFPAIISRSLSQRHADRGQLHPLASNPYHATWNKGGAAFARPSAPTT